MNTIKHYRLWQIISPAFPVGMFAYSAGLEFAVEAGWVSSKASTQTWLEQQLEFNLQSVDLPLLSRFYAAWQAQDDEGLAQWSNFLWSIRESREMLNEDQQLAKTMVRVLTELGLTQAKQYEDLKGASYLLFYALACQHWDIDLTTSLQAYVWAWLENQVSAAIKLVPLGHLAGQSILSTLIDKIDAVVDAGLACPDEEIGLNLQALAIGSALHEYQYTRLFRS